MQENDYTFVTVDSDDAFLSDAVIVDVDGGTEDFSDMVMIDDMSEDYVQIDMTMPEDLDFVCTSDGAEIYSADFDGSDISFIL